MLAALRRGVLGMMRGSFYIEYAECACMIDGQQMRKRLGGRARVNEVLRELTRQYAH